MRQPPQAIRQPARSCVERSITHSEYELIVLSPHLDDAVLSCGGLIAASRATERRVLVVSFFTGDPRHPISPLAYRFHRLWQAAGNNPYVLRRHEERQAMSLLDLDYIWAGYPEIIYRNRMLFTWQQVTSRTADPTKDSIFPAICRSIESLQHSYPTACFVAPLGVGGHRDHCVVREAARRVVEPGTLCFYEDFPYSMRNAQELTALATRYQLVADEVDITDVLSRRIDATQVYTSQLAALFGSTHDLPKTIRSATASALDHNRFIERYWRDPAQSPIVAYANLS